VEKFGRGSAGEACTARELGGLLFASLAGQKDLATTNTASRSLVYIPPNLSSLASASHAVSIQTRSWTFLRYA
jgi:hypothetical protein